MTTQEETIVWHKYPEEKPPVDGNDTILVHEKITDDYGNEYDYVTDDCWYIEGKTDMSHVIAWAERPKGWKEE